MPILHKTKGAFKCAITQETGGIGRVLDVRSWPNSNLIEIDLHLPAVDMLDWKEVMQITLSINKVCSREVVPFGWDAETATCSLILDTVRACACTTWVKQLRRLDQVEYTKIRACSEKLPVSNLIVAIGDSSNLGFLLAVQQVVMPAYRFEALAWFKRSHTSKLFQEYFNTRTIPVANKKDLLTGLVSQQYCANHTSFYLGGDSCFNNNISESLKAMNYHNIQVLDFDDSTLTILH
jgi:hypothetical protein